MATGILQLNYFRLGDQDKVAAHENSNKSSSDNCTLDISMTPVACIASKVRPPIINDTPSVLAPMPLTLLWFIRTRQHADPPVLAEQCSTVRNNFIKIKS